MKKCVSFILVLVLVFICFSVFPATATMTNDNKLTKKLISIVESADAEEIISVYVFITHPDFWYKKKPGFTEEETREEYERSIREYKDKVFANIPDDLFYEEYDFFEWLPDVTVFEIKASDIPGLAQCDCINRLDYYEKKDSKSADYKYFDRFKEWACIYYGLTEFEIPVFTNSGKNGYITNYKELYDKYDEQGNLEWALIYVNTSIPLQCMEPHTVVCDRKLDRYSPAPIDIGAELQTPFTIGYGIYNPSTDCFNDLYYFKGDEYDGLDNMMAELCIGNPIGDVDKDGKVSIVDATGIQQRLANLLEWDDSYDVIYPDELTHKTYDLAYISDFNRDKNRDIADCTCIQQYLAKLINLET